MAKGGIFRFKQSIIVLVAADAAAAEAFTNVVIVVVYLFVQILLFLLLLGFFACNCSIPLLFFYLPSFIRLNHSRKGGRAVAAAKVGHSAHVCHSCIHPVCVCVLINQLLFLSSTLHPVLVLLLEEVVGFRAMYTVLRGSYGYGLHLSV